jgi:hypothetical protein
MCVTVQNKYVPLMLLTAYRAPGLGVSNLKEHTDDYIKEMVIVPGGLIMINI